MRDFRQKLALASISAIATMVSTVAPTVIGQDHNSGAKKICEKIPAAKICVANLKLQVNSDEPLTVKNHELVPLKAGNSLRILDMNYCVLSQTTVNKLVAKAYLFNDGVESYQNGISTFSSFPISSGCYDVGEFQTSWKNLQAGKHQIIMAMIKYDGSNRIVDKNFYISLDVGE